MKNPILRLSQRIKQSPKLEMLGYGNGNIVDFSSEYSYSNLHSESAINKEIPQILTPNLDPRSKIFNPER